MSPIPEIITSDIDHISGHDILYFIAMAYHTTFVAHPYISGFFLIMWSYYPKAPFQALAYLLWMFPKKAFFWMLRSRGFHVEGDNAQTNGYIPTGTPFARSLSYGTVSETSDTNNTNEHEGRVDEVSIWWRIFGMTLYLSGFGVMLAYGSLKGL